MLHERDTSIMSIETVRAGAQPARGVPSGDVPLEKVALETYVPPARPSLIGLSRAEIAERLAAIGVAPAFAWK